MTAGQRKAPTISSRCLYAQLDHEAYKALEDQMKAFEETVHKTVTGFYHKSIRLQLGGGLVVEFHGPCVASSDPPACRTAWMIQRGHEHPNQITQYWTGEDHLPWSQTIEAGMLFVRREDAARIMQQMIHKGPIKEMSVVRHVINVGDDQ